jgi:hypothetical protein
MKHQNLNNDVLDREIDAALAKFTTANPRTGLEERILANLRIEQKRAAERSWWRWPAVAALAAVIAVAVFVAWRSQKPAQKIAMQHSPAVTRAGEHPGTQVATNGGGRSILLPGAGSRGKPRTRAVRRPTTVVASAPKLDQFPSPQPLSQQETMLTQYVAEHHRQAVLIARVRMAELKKDWLEEMEEASAIANRATSDSPAIQQENQ